MGEIDTRAHDLASKDSRRDDYLLHPPSIGRGPLLRSRLALLCVLDRPHKGSYLAKQPCGKVPQVGVQLVPGRDDCQPGVVHTRRAQIVQFSRLNVSAGEMP